MGIANADTGLLTLRLGMGGMMLAAHGWPKFLNYSQMMNSFPDPFNIGAPISLALAVFAELFCAAALIVGFYPRLAAIPLIVTMAVAALIVHGEDPFAKKELALVYGIAFLTILIGGGGRYSLKNLRFS